MEITVHKLADLRLKYRAMSSIQSVWSFEEYKDYLSGFAQHDAVAVLAWDNGQIIGSMVYVPAMSLSPVSDNEALVCFCDDAGYDLNNAIVRCAIFVDPAYRGQGISRTIETAVFDDARAKGFSVVVDYAYATDDVLSWIKSSADVIETSILDADSKPILLTLF